MADGKLGDSKWNAAAVGVGWLERDLGCKAATARVSGQGPGGSQLA
jgi:hypothetical protein